MESVFFKRFGRFFLLAAFIFSVAGCGSNSSTADNGTGLIAAKLVWSSPESKASAKTLYAFPAGVINIKIFVRDAAMKELITPQEFKDPSASSGTINGIPAGIGRVVRVEGLDSSGYLRYLGTATVDILAGQTTPVTIMMQAPVTTAYPDTAPSAARFDVTLTASVPATTYYTTNEPATIYYTTNGTDPTIGNGLDPATASPHGTSPVGSIWIEPGPAVTLKYFAVVRGLYEAIKTKIYR